MNESARALEVSLNGIIDNELRAEAPDFETVCEAVDGLLRLELTDRYVVTFAQRAKSIDFAISDALDRLAKSRAAKILLVAALLAALLTVAAVASSKPEFKIIDYGTYSDVVFGLIPSSRVTDFEVTYLPEGFELTSEEKFKTLIVKQYANNDTTGHIVISKDNDTNVSIETEFSDAEIIEINGIRYIKFGKENVANTIVWADSKFMYTVSSSLPYEEVLKIAQNIVQK